MRVLLMHPDFDFDLGKPLPLNQLDLTRDLELEVLFGAMSNGDKLIGTVAQVAVLAGELELGTIAYRQAVLSDCLSNPEFTRAVYHLAITAIETERRQWGWFHDSSQSLLSRSLRVMDQFVEILQRLRELCEANHPKLKSEGLTRMTEMIQAELSDPYLAEIRAQTKKLKFDRGVMVTAALGAGARGSSYVLREQGPLSWRERILTLRRSGYSFQVHPRDEAGARQVGELAGRGLNLAANVLGQSVEHIVSFFKQLRTELAFYVGCLNLHERLSAKGEPWCIPSATAPQPHRLDASGLYDVCLSLRIDAGVVGNDAYAKDASVILITGANRGGKSTFLRGLGLAQLMMQAGMFVGAQAFTANLRERVFTHYKREEDKTMSSGKLVEELQRMSGLAENMTPLGMLLCNESFASTNELEASEISYQVITALTQAGMKVVFVTHLYSLGQRLYESETAQALYLRADPAPDGTPTFKLIEGPPLPTSHGEELYWQIFGPSV